MSATLSWNLEIDPQIDRHPDLRAAILAATDYLETLTVSAPPPDRVRWTVWGPATADPPKGVQLEMADVIGSVTYAFSRQYLSHWLHDPDSRKVCVLRVWSDLNLDRAKRSGERVTSMLQQLEEEGDAPPDSE